MRDRYDKNGRLSVAERKRRRIRRRHRERFLWISTILLVPALAVVLAAGILRLLKSREPGREAMAYEKKYIADAPEFQVRLLDMNEYSRPGTALPEVKGIVVHYTANPGTSAEENRNYFENLKDTQETSASSHFIIGYDGEIIQCIPREEIAYAVKGRNYDSISIECCHLAKDGSFTDATYQSLLHLVDWLLYEYDLQPEDVLRHYDAGGKPCPLYYVEHEDAWERLLEDLKQD